MNSNLRLEVPPYGFLDDLSSNFSKGILESVCDSVLGVPEGLINLPVTGGVQGFLSSSFNDKKFNSDMFSGIPRVF